MTGVKRWGGRGLDGLVEGLTRAATLLIDDIEHLLGDAEREALVLRVFAGRISAGRPTVVTSRLHPACLPLSPSLASIDAMPDVAIASLSPLLLRERRAIVEREVAAQRTCLPASVTAFIARNGRTTETRLRSLTRRYLLSARTVAVPAPLPFNRALTR
jgi:chromosomal replication initiation ATPase DnaA